jgi:omega-6 fatty acid desaturase (delta-12 desaturase)
VAFSFPSAPDERFEEFMRKAEALEGERLAKAIPRECFEPRVSRGLLGFAVSWAVYLGAVAGLLLAPHWLLWIPLWIVAGLGGWGLHVIAHDCGHGSFSRSQRFNDAIGHVALLPLMYPFHAWRHVHYMHHSHANNIELDTDWRPLPPDAFRRLPLWRKAVYGATRTWAFWGGTINYWLSSAFRPSFYPSARMRREVRLSIAFVLLVGVPYLVALTWLTGVGGLLVLFVGPVGGDARVVQHDDAHAPQRRGRAVPDVRALDAQREPAPRDDRLPVPPVARLPDARHRGPHAPPRRAGDPVLQPAPRAGRAQGGYPGMLREQDLRPGELWKIVRSLHLYDTESGFYSDFSGKPVPQDAKAEAPAEKVESHA